MLRTAVRLQACVFFLLLTHYSFSQTQLPHTLLWRISGKGLQKPSYLWGTIHLQDKRLFQFGDSLYRALEITDGYAMEINPAEFMDSLFTGVMRKEEDKLLESKKVSINRQKLSKSADSLLRSIGINGNLATKKDLKKIRDRRTLQLLQQGEMPTIMDAYLFGLAHRLNKWTGGIEDVSDQLNLSDELGGELEPESVLQPEENFKRSIDNMLHIYLAQNLDDIDRYSNASYNAKDKDAMLIHRNMKMAYRMDSLSHVRSMFFTVGAAHLPGDSGVISELRNRGFTVEPVFSSSKRFAGDYAATLPEAKWQTVDGDKDAYKVNMPGQPSDYGVFGGILKMKMYFDMTTMTFYLAGAIATPKATDMQLDEMMAGAVQNITGKSTPVKAKLVEVGSVKGREVTIENEGAVFRLQLLVQNKTVFMLIAGGMSKKSMNSPDVEKYFASFQPHAPVITASAWDGFSLEEKGITVQTPTTFTRNEAIDKKMAQTGVWKSESYNAVDPNTGFFYMLQVRETVGDSFIDGDSTFFEKVKLDFRGSFDSFSRVQTTTLQSYPAMYLDGYSVKEKAIYKTLCVTRGNRVYLLLAGATAGSSTTDLDRFLSSVNILPVTASLPTLQTIDGFSTKVAGTLQKGTSDTAEQRKQRMQFYYAVDDKSTARYYVYKTRFSPNYWIKNDSSYFNERIDAHLGKNDSLLKKAWVRNGGLKGLEMLVQSQGFNGVKKWRFFVNADTLYTLYSIVQPQDTANVSVEAFFSDFRVAREVAPGIYSRKATVLLENLKSNDSATFADAAEHLKIAQFDASDLPQLQKALLLNYRDEDDRLGTVKQTLLELNAKFADANTIHFVKEVYPQIKTQNPSAQYDLLALLAKLKTKESFDALKQVTARGFPAVGHTNYLHVALLDSMQLTAMLYPSFAQYAADSLLGFTVAMATKSLLDSGLIKREDALLYQKQILQGARAAMQDTATANGTNWQLITWSKLLGKLNVPEGNLLLQKMLVNSNAFLREQAVVDLLRNNQTVSPNVILTVAADKQARMQLYEDLVKLHKQSLFPAVYATQKSLAETELYNLFEEDYENVALKYIGERERLFNGKRQRFQLFRFTYDEGEDGEKKTYLAVAGPYALTGIPKAGYSSASGYYGDEAFALKQTDKLLDAFLAKQKPAE